ncbi:MAG: hypothetical protein IJQ89_02450 [Bacteroidales bacterium]|nr:hypothetical protein [Bacteroidales bacterium]
MKNKQRYFLFIEFIFALLVGACSEKEMEHVRTEQIADSLYVETYQTYFGGVWAGDSYEVYLTDSTSFRKLLGDYDDHLWPAEYKVLAGDVIITWLENERNISRHLRRTYSCNVKQLKKEGYDDIYKRKY